MREDLERRVPVSSRAKAQRSGFSEERTNSGTSELSSPLRKRDNVKLVRTHEAELARIAREVGI